MKIEKVLDVLEEVKWPLSRFPEESFKSSTDRSVRHQRVLTSMMHGTTKPYFAEVLGLAFENARIAGFKSNDSSIPPGHNMLNRPLS